MLAAFAGLGRPDENLFAFAACPPNTLTRLPVVPILAACFGRSLEDDLLWRGVPVGDDGRILGPFLDHSRPFLAALFPLRLGALGRQTWAHLAAQMPALRAFSSDPKRGTAKVALPVHAHPDGLFHAERVALGLVPFAGLNLQAVQFTELLRSLSKNLRPRDLGGLNGSRSWCSCDGLAAG